VSADTRLGQEVRRERGRPLSKPVLDFMEGYFRRSLRHVRMSDGPEAQALARDLGVEALATGDRVFLGKPRTAEGAGEAERLATLGHEIAHVVGEPVVAVPAQAVPGSAATARYALDRGERRARQAEREVYAAARRQERPQQQQRPLAQRSPRLPMEVAAIRPPETPEPVQKKASSRFADTAMQFIETGSRIADIAQQFFPRPPRADLTALCFQIYQKIKRELAIQRERQAGGF
jgi:hypothetical protein